MNDSSLARCGSKGKENLNGPATTLTTASVIVIIHATATKKPILHRAIRTARRLLNKNGEIVDRSCELA